MTISPSKDALSGKLRKALLIAAVPVLGLAGVALAQMPPDEDAPSKPGKYVDSSNYDPEPYYVDGVEFKPYVPEGARKPAPKPGPSAPSASSPSVSPVTSAQVPGASSASGQADLRGPIADEEASAAADIPPPPVKRQRHGAAIIQALDKVTAETVRFEARIGKPVRYKGLIYTVKACETTTPEESQADIIAYLEVHASPQMNERTNILSKPRQIFRGWTYASTPGINGLQHPVYDAWVIDCRAPLVARKS